MADIISIPIHERLRKRRVEVLGIGLREMAAQLGIAAPYLTNIEKGNRVPSEDLMLRIEILYGIPLAVLRAGWSRPDEVVKQVASQDVTTAVKVPEFLRTARNLSADQWDTLIRQASRMSGRTPKRRKP